MRFTQTLYLLIVAILLTIVGLATKGWGGCGNLIVNCNSLGYLVAKIFMLVGCGFLAIAFLCELIYCCLPLDSPRLEPTGMARSVCCLVASITFFCGILIVTHEVGNIYSYLGIVMAASFLLHANALFCSTVSFSHRSP